MSFRYYIGYVKKQDIKKMENLSYSELIKKYGEDDCFRPYDVAKELYGLGSEFDSRILKNKTRKIFKQHKTHIEASYGDNYFYKLTPLGFKAIIESFHQKILEGYKKDLSRLNSDDNYEKEMLKRNMQSKVDEWNKRLGFTPYNLETPLDLTKESSLIHSWKYEYAIFELVLKYKTFDWKNNQLVIYGY